MNRVTAGSGRRRLSRLVLAGAVLVAALSTAGMAAAHEGDHGDERGHAVACQNAGAAANNPHCRASQSSARPDQPGSEGHNTDGAEPAIVPEEHRNHDVDGDGDGVPNRVDNCPTVSNASQQNSDARPGEHDDRFGDACDDDNDDDNINDSRDNCPHTHNPDQADRNGYRDGRGAGDACETPEQDRLDEGAERAQQEAERRAADAAAGAERRLAEGQAEGERRAADAQAEAERQAAHVQGTAIRTANYVVGSAGL